MNLIDNNQRFSPARHPAASLLLGDSRPDLIRDRVLPELFREAVEKGPDRTVFITPSKLYSYREIDDAANAIAAGLQQQGIGPGDVVGLWFRRGVPLLTAQIAITRSGAAWLPFDRQAGDVDRLGGLHVRAQGHAEPRQRVRHHDQVAFQDGAVEHQAGRWQIGEFHAGGVQLDTDDDDVGTRRSSRHGDAIGRRYSTCVLCCARQRARTFRLDP